MGKFSLFSSVLVITILIFSMTPAFGDTWYVRPNGGDYGLENGTSWSDAFDGFNDISWGDISPGDTIYLSGGTYREVWSVPVSGAENMPITIKRATISDHGNDSGWQLQYDSRLYLTNPGQGPVIDMGRRNISWVTIDGSTRDGIHLRWRSGHGAILMNPDVQHTVSNITLKNILIDGSLLGQGPGIPFKRGISRGVYMKHSGAAEAGKYLDYITLENLTIRNINNDPILVLAIHNLLIQGCIIEKRARPGGHGDALEVWFNNENVVVRQNIFKWDGQNIFFNGSAGDHGGNKNWYIYSNLFYNDGTWTNTAAQVAIKSRSSDPVVEGPIYFVNNTVVDYRRLHGFLSNANAIFYNNISWNNDKTPNFYSNTIHDYNYYSSGDGEGEPNQIVGGNPFSDYTSGDFTLKADSDAIAAGTNLGSVFQEDMLGRLRDSNGPWDMGAYKYTDSSDTLAPAPPTLIEVFTAK